VDIGHDGKPGMKRDLRRLRSVPRKKLTMTASEFEACIRNWAFRTNEVEALIQIGSRVQSGGEVDDWSDWDYQVIVSDVPRFLELGWLEGIARVWSAHRDETERGVTKLSAVFADGWEADFVPLSSWQMKLVYWAMAHPRLEWCYPERLLAGIKNTRLVVRPGFKIIKGAKAWHKRLEALSTDWGEREIDQADYTNMVSGFWRHAVWVSKKVLRGEVRAALRWYHLEMVERRLALLFDEASLVGSSPRPEARKAERWLNDQRLRQTAIQTAPDQRTMAIAVLAEIELFEEVSLSVAQSRGFSVRDYSNVARWLKAEMGKLT